MKLLIIESAGKVDALKKYLGADWAIGVSYGHVRDLPQKDIGVEPPSFSPRYDYSERGKSVVARLKALAGKASEVYLATDPDREGEAIAWHLASALKLKSPQRITFHSVTKDEVLAAVRSPRPLDMRLVQAQEARRVLDRLVGYMVSGPVSAACGQSGLSAGRVQSVAVRLVVEREAAIEAFKATEHYGARLDFGGWSAEWLPDALLAKGQKYWLDRAFAEKAASVREARVVGVRESTTSREPPAPFTTSTLQQAASVALGLSPADSMALAQKLYEAGHITYMRTDSPNLSDSGYKSLVAYAAACGLALSPARRVFPSKALAQEGHEAIRPARFEAEEAGATDAERALYRLIRLRALASQMPAAQYAVRVVTLRSVREVDGHALDFEARGSTLTHAGWLALTASDAAEEAPAEGQVKNPVPALAKGQQLQVKDGQLLVKTTKAPARYTEASLIKELEDQGIGRPSTYASIMETVIRKRGYVRLDGKKLYATPIARAIIGHLVGRFSFAELDFTRKAEEELDAVAQGKATYLEVVRGAYDTLQDELGRFATAVPAAAPRPRPVLSAYKCAACGKPLVHRQKPGAYDFWGCSGFPGCKKTYRDTGGKPAL